MSTTRKHIIIDIGHARNTGAVGCGLQEHTRCGQIAGHLRAKLEDAGYIVTVIDFPDKDNRADLYILNHTRAPWVLCECGFITNPRDVQAGPEAIATAIANGVSHYFNS